MLPWWPPGTPRRFVLPDLHAVEHYDRHLTLDGLRLVFERNRDSQRGRLKQAR